MLAMIGIVDCIFCCVGLRPSHFHSKTCALGLAVLFPSRWGGTELFFVAPGADPGFPGGRFTAWVHMRANIGPHPFRKTTSTNGQ